MKDKSTKRISKHEVTLNIEKEKLDDNFISRGDDVIRDNYGVIVEGEFILHTSRESYDKFTNDVIEDLVKKLNE